MARYGLARSERVRKTGEYQEIRKRGRRVTSPHFILTFLPRESGGLRLGLVVGRRAGKAHERNRLKRWVREFFRQKRPALQEELDRQGINGSRGLDLAFAARPGSAELEHDRVERELESLLGRMLREYEAGPGDAGPGRKRGT